MQGQKLRDCIPFVHKNVSQGSTNKNKYHSKHSIDVYRESDINRDEDAATLNAVNLDQSINQIQLNFIAPTSPAKPGSAAQMRAVSKTRVSPYRGGR